ncbi:hypothetical protein GUJ93_ZPchr0005g14248 [Zizania palustris]|uniref:Uncharacterized protein n=1 Tax=Zizania palustris TaxID=103762 RepID=A0A8J5S318_ZIZPA|nr:hypothetical protein GUJ93_ZPchr0005g14248 [Zizania palustris]
MGANAEPTGPLGGPQRNPSPASLAPQHAVAASTAAALRHDPGLAVRWTPEEQATLEGGLAGPENVNAHVFVEKRKTVSVFSCCVGVFVGYAADAVVVRYAKIAMTLPDKTVRDVALRCRWMAKKESSKKRKEELSKKSKEKKEKASDSSTKGPAHLVSRPNAPPYSLPVLPMDDDDVSYKKAILDPATQKNSSKNSRLCTISSLPRPEPQNRSPFSSKSQRFTGILS